jgi:DUF4097 and DUF4098 domain-containing protein YvlB
MRTVPPLLILVFASVAAHAGERTFERQVAAEPRGTVEITDVSGRIDVSGWDRPEVDVRADLDSGVERVDVTSESGRTVVKVVLPSHSFHSGDARLRVHIPKGSNLEISAVSADVTSENVEGAQRLRTVSGEIKAAIASDVEVKTVSGNVTLRGRGRPGQLHISTVSGDLRLERGAGDLEVTTISGDLSLRLDSAHSVRVRTTSGDLGFEGKLTRGASLDAESVSGGVRVHAGAEAGYEYEAVTFSGDIKDCFNAEAQRTSKYGPGSRLVGKRGEGGGRVRLKTMSGDVDLCDRP